MQKSEGTAENEQWNDEKYFFFFLQMFSLLIFWGSNATSHL